MDLEGYAKRALRRGENHDNILRKLIERIIEAKDISEDKASTLAKAVLEEAEVTLRPDADKSIVVSITGMLKWIRQHILEDDISPLCLLMYW